MAELCFSVDDFVVLFSSNFSNWYIRIYIYVSWEPAELRQSTALCSMSQIEDDVYVLNITAVPKRKRREDCERSV